MDEDFPAGLATGADGPAVQDLFGDPYTEPRDPRGRKKLKVTNELRHKVAVLRAAGFEREEIADACGCSERTLRTYLLPELNEGKVVKRAEAVLRLYELGMAGNVSALKAYLALTEKADAIPQLPRAAKLGKKEQAIQDAQTAHHGSRWGAILEQPVH